MIFVNVFFSFFFRAYLSAFYAFQAVFVAGLSYNYLLRIMVFSYPFLGVSNLICSGLFMCGIYEILPLTCCFKSEPQVIHLKWSRVIDTSIVLQVQVGHVPLTTSVLMLIFPNISYNSFYLRLQVFHLGKSTAKTQFLFLLVCMCI